MVLGQQQQQIGVTLYCRYVAEGALALALALSPLTKTENRANVNAPYDAFTLTHTTAES